MSTSSPATTNSITLPLPETLNPDHLDVLSELADLLTRLPIHNNSNSNSNNNNPNNNSTPSQQQPPAAQKLALALKDIPAATDALRHRFHRARQIIKASLPDLDRGVADQEAEIAALEARVARQRDVLVRLREVGSSKLGVVDGNGEGDPMEM
ncbi:RNA polymerase II transcription mediator complex subunit 9-domain-containing protein [Xylariaceae sp. FL0594]|nr:RNA polymerase II transcription mediator complex subunit 9-domain-containing protein [Xylariaceae sp. FL0594]